LLIAKFGIEAIEFYPCLVGSELPFHSLLIVIAFHCPGNPKFCD